MPKYRVEIVHESGLTANAVRSCLRDYFVTAESVEVTEVEEE
jgi:hypothetical protein